MTRKDFLLISGAVREARRKLASLSTPQSPRLFAVDDVARELADALGRDNGRFDKERFLKDCGVNNNA